MKNEDKIILTDEEEQICLLLIHILENNRTTLIEEIEKELSPHLINIDILCRKRFIELFKQEPDIFLKFMKTKEIEIASTRGKQMAAEGVDKKKIFNLFKVMTLFLYNHMGNETGARINFIDKIRELYSKPYFLAHIQMNFDPRHQERNLHTSEKDRRGKTNESNINFLNNLALAAKKPLKNIQKLISMIKEEAGTTPSLVSLEADILSLRKRITDIIDNKKILHDVQLYNHEHIVNISTIVMTKIELIKDIVADKDIQLTQEIAPDLYIRIAPPAIDRILNIILDNAIKYNAPKDGNIHIDLKTENNNIVLIIRDTGIGIPPEQLKHIYEPYHVYAYNKRCNQGIGLGLSLVKNILAGVSGQITITSKINRGTVVSLILKSEKITLDNIDIVIEKVKLTNPPVRKNIRLKPETYDEKKKTIIFVHYHLKLLSIIQNSLDKDYNVYYARHGQEALRKLKTIPKPDVIVSDTIMEIMDGYEFYAKVKQKDELQHIPFIFLAARIEIVEKLHELKSGPGIVEFMEIPFEIVDLKEKIIQVINKNKSIHS
ncbi:MAG: response regulator [Spirochaetales bacterium]|nr:response regulator [Spirochaetales bacterium]